MSEIFYCYGKKDFCENNEKCTQNCSYYNGKGGEYMPISTGVTKEYFTSERDYDYEIVCGNIKGNYPAYFKLPEKSTGTQKDQKSTDYCVAMVISSIAEAYWNRVLNIAEEHSESFIYGAFRAENSKSSGLIPTTAMQSWCDIGTVFKNDFDAALIEMPEIKELVSNHPELTELAKHLKLSAYVNIRGNATSTKDEQIKDALMKYNYGLLAIQDSHAMQLVGWDDAKEKYILKDSYGAKKGDNGYVNVNKSSIDAIYLPLFEPVTLPFEDVPENAWYYNHVKHMYLANIMNGTSEKTFEPDKPITRAEAAALCNRILKAVETRDKILNDIINTKLNL